MDDPDATPQAPAASKTRISRVLIIDDHPLFCDALALTLHSISAVRDVAVAHSLGAALDLIETGPTPDLVLLDLNLPDVDGLDGLMRLRTVLRVIPVIVVSSLSEPRMITSALAAGAQGFVPKDARREMFRQALDTVAAGQVFTPDPTTLGTASSESLALERMALLTRQQGKILEMICQGKLNKQIAWELAIAETTVKAHVTAIMRKLGVQSRTQAVLMAQQARFSSLLPDA